MPNTNSILLIIEFLLNMIVVVAKCLPTAFAICATL